MLHLLHSDPCAFKKMSAKCADNASASMYSLCALCSYTAAQVNNVHCLLAVVMAQLGCIVASTGMVCVIDDGVDVM